MDLGANEWVTFRKVTLPLIAPAILAALLLCFAISIDDFVVTYFVAGSSVDVPAVRLGSRARRRAAAGERDRDVHLRRRRDRDGRERARSDAARTSSRGRLSAPSVEPRLPPWWLDEAGRQRPRRRWTGDAVADVCIVGGGYTGLWTALGAEGAGPFCDGRPCGGRRRAARARVGATADSCTATGRPSPICCRCSDRIERWSSHVPGSGSFPACVRSGGRTTSGCARAGC